MQACTSNVGQTRRNLSQVEHSANDSTIASSERTKQPLQQDGQQGLYHPQQHSNAASSGAPTTEAPEKLVHKPIVKWPKANDRDAWMSFKASLLTILQSLLWGSVASTMAIFSRIVYEEGILRFRTKPERETGSKQCGRREREILQLVKEQRLLWKAWRKAQGQKKEGLKSLWDQIKSRLAHLIRAEKIRKRRGRKEKARASFLKDSFKYARCLLEKSKSRKRSWRATSRGS